MTHFEAEFSQHDGIFTQQVSFPSLSVRKEFNMKFVACGGSGEEEVEGWKRGKEQNKKKYKFVIWKFKDKGFVFIASLCFLL